MEVLAENQRVEGPDACWEGPGGGSSREAKGLRVLMLLGRT